MTRTDVFFVLVSCVTGVLLLSSSLVIADDDSTNAPLPTEGPTTSVSDIVTKGAEGTQGVDGTQKTQGTQVTQATVKSNDTKPAVTAAPVQKANQGNNACGTSPALMTAVGVVFLSIILINN